MATSKKTKEIAFKYSFVNQPLNIAQQIHHQLKTSYMHAPHMRALCRRLEAGVADSCKGVNARDLERFLQSIAPSSAMI